MEYSGKTTCFAHKHGDSWKTSKGFGEDCIQQKTIFEVQWTNCPVEVQDEVRELWTQNGFGNDHYYAKWVDDGEHEDAYPIISEYLKSRGIKECLIHWWW